jgi:hypothetical protein
VFLMWKCRAGARGRGCDVRAWSFSKIPIVACMRLVSGCSAPRDSQCASVEASKSEAFCCLYVCLRYVYACHRF